MPFTPFKNLRRISDNTGSIDPSQTEADEILHKYSFQIDCSDITGFNLEVIKVGADFVMSDAGGNEILAWNFRVTYLAGNDVFGFVYYSTAQSVTQTFPVPPVPVIGDPNGIVLTGGGYGPTGAQLIFDAFESPIFVVNVPNGATVKITFHNAGFPYLIDLASLQVSTRLAGGNVSGFRNSRDGEAVVVFPSSGGVTQFRATGRNRTLTDKHSVLDAASGKAIAADGAAFVLRPPGCAVQTLLYARSGGTLARDSTLDGLTYGTEMAVYPNYTLLGADCWNRDGILLLLNDKAGKTYVATRGKDGLFTTPVLCTLPSGVKLSSPGQLICHGQGSTIDFFYTSTAGAEHLYSTTDGLTWAQTAAP